MGNCAGKEAQISSETSSTHNSADSQVVGEKDDALKRRDVFEEKTVEFMFLIGMGPADQEEYLKLYSTLPAHSPSLPLPTSAEIYSTLFSPLPPCDSPPLRFIRKLLGYYFNFHSPYSFRGGLSPSASPLPPQRSTPNDPDPGDEPSGYSLPPTCRSSAGTGFTPDDFLLESLNFCALPRGDFMMRFIFELYGGAKDGMTPKGFGEMVSDIILGLEQENGEKGEKGLEVVKEWRLVRLLDYYIKKEKNDFNEPSDGDGDGDGDGNGNGNGDGNGDGNGNGDTTSPDPSLLTDPPKPNDLSLAIISPSHPSHCKPLISFTHLVKAERRLRGEGLYHSACVCQDRFRRGVLGEEWWEKRQEKYRRLLYERDLWNHSDLYSFGVRGKPVPEDYHDVQYADEHHHGKHHHGRHHHGEHHGKSTHHHHGGKSAHHHSTHRKDNKDKDKHSHSHSHHHHSTHNTAHKERRPSVSTRIRTTSEENYATHRLKSHAHPTTAAPSAAADAQTFMVLNEKDTKIGPGGITPQQAFKRMPRDMVIAFQTKNMEKLRALAKGEGDITKEIFERGMELAEDAGLWEGNH